MKGLRNHIVKWSVVVLVWTGFGIYLCQPVRSDHISRTFTNWLNSVVKNDDSADLIKQINELKEAEPGISNLLHRASIIISNHNEDFNLPLAGETSRDHVYRLLLTEWNFIHTGNAMGKPAVPNSEKTVFNPQANKLFAQSFSTIFGENNKPAGRTLPDAHDWPSVLVPSFNIAPLSGGIAIGAP